QHAWLQVRGQFGGAMRLTYLLNPLLPCASPLMGSRWVTRLAELLPALEDAAGRVDRKQSVPIDPHVAAFVSARLERRWDGEWSGLAGGGGAGGSCLAQLRLLSQLQSRFHAQPLPALAAWLAAQAG